MTTHFTLRLVAIASMGTLLATPLLAQDKSYYYGGLSVGQARAYFNADRMAGSVLGAGITPTMTERDERDTAYKIFGGYQFGPYFGVELGYFDLGGFNYNATTVPAGTMSGRYKVMGGNFDLVGTLPITEKFSAQARVGAQFARTTGSYTSTGGATLTNTNPASRDTNVKAGVGLQYAFTPGFMVRGEAERYRINDVAGGTNNIDVMSVSLVFPLGRAPAPAPRAMAPAPMEVAVAPPSPPAPAPAPVMVAPPPAVVLQRVTYSAESLFGFDHANIRPAGLTALDGFARELTGAKFDMVVVEGHTDRLGSQAYNQKLSQERADTVKEYLVTSGKIDPMKIRSVGKSESMPVTKPDDCKGTTQSAKLIACLQPDRRVDIEVTGTR